MEYTYTVRELKLLRTYYLNYVGVTMNPIGDYLNWLAKENRVPLIK